jgi:predicted  nucleic acid-binding Zn-ribbon protein
MRDTHASPAAVPRATRAKANPPEPPARSREISALLRLAELDSARLDRRDERDALVATLSPEVLEAYHRALRGGRQPAVVRLVASVCTGCHMRLHSKLDHQIRQRRGVAPCPRCLRLVYDPAWLAS